MEQQERKSLRFFSIQWHITDRCDQRCIHCYIYRGGKEPVAVYGRELNFIECCTVLGKFISFCKMMECVPSLAITGGDPILCPHFWDLLSLIHEKGIPFSIMGNPFHLNPVVCKRLRDLGCKTYQMSLDGLEKTHDSLRGRRGSFRSTLAGIKPLKDSGIKAHIMNTVSLLNYQELPELVRTVVDHEADTFAFARYCPTPGDADYNIPPNEYKKFLQTMWLVYSELANRETTFPLKDHLWTLFLYEQGLFKIDPVQRDTILDGCNLGIRHMTVLPDGTVYACRRFDSPVGHALKDSFEDIFLGERMEQYRDFDKLEGCKDCELLAYCRGCHAVSYGTSGSFFAKDPQCWKT